MAQSGRLRDSQQESDYRQALERHGANVTHETWSKVLSRYLLVLSRDRKITYLRSYLLRDR